MENEDFSMLTPEEKRMYDYGHRQITVLAKKGSDLYEETKDMLLKLKDEILDDKNTTSFVETMKTVRLWDVRRTRD